MTLAASDNFARVLIFALALAAAAIVVCRYEPRIGAAERSLADSEQLSHNDEITFANESLLRAERGSLRERLRPFLNGQPEATFVRELAAIAQRRHLRVLSTAFERSAPAAVAPVSSLPERLPRENASIVLEGSYPNLLVAISDLSRGDALVAVGWPNLHRAAGALVAQIPLTLSDPPRAPAP